MIVKFSNPVGTRVSVDHEDGTMEDVPTTDGNPTWIGILQQVAAGTLTIEPFEIPNDDDPGNTLQRPRGRKKAK
jgi:hypothetical protein